jgi:colicin import membrane protein
VSFEALTVELRELSAALEQAENERRSESLARLAAESLLHSERERLSGVEAELARARAAAADELEETHVPQDDDAQALAERLNEARGRIGELEAQVQQAAELEAERKMLAQRIGELEEAVARRDNDARALGAQLSEARGRVAELEGEARQVDVEWDLLRSELEAEQQRSAEAAAEIRSTLDAERERLVRRIGELEEKLGGRENEVRGLGEQVSEARGRLEAQAQRAASIEAEGHRLRAALGAVRDRLQTELEEVRQRSEEAAAELRSTLRASVRGSPGASTSWKGRWSDGTTRHACSRSNCTERAAGSQSSRRRRNKPRR